MKPLSILTLTAAGALIIAGCFNLPKHRPQFGKMQPVPPDSMTDGHFLGDIYHAPDLSAAPKSQLNMLKGFDAAALMTSHRKQAPDSTLGEYGLSTAEFRLQLKKLFEAHATNSTVKVVSVNATNVFIYSLPSDAFGTEVHPRLRWDSATALTGKYYVAKLVQASEGVLTLANNSSTGGGIETEKALNALASGGVQLTKQAGQNYHFKLKTPTFIYYQLERITKDAPYALKDIPSESKAFYYNWENPRYTQQHRRFGAHVNIHTKVWLSVTDTQIVVNAQSDAYGGPPGREARIRLEVENGTSKEPIPFTLPGHLTNAALHKPATHLTELKATSVIPSRPFIRNQNEQRDIHVTRNGPVADWASFDPFEVEGDTGGPKPGFTVRLTPLVIKAQITTGKQ